MNDLFDPDTMLLSDELLQRYEEVLKKLSERELYVWLLYRRGLSKGDIVRALVSQDGMRANERKVFFTYRKRVERMLKEVQKRLKSWCMKGKE